MSFDTGETFTAYRVRESGAVCCPDDARSFRPLSAERSAFGKVCRSIVSGVLIRRAADFIERAGLPFQCVAQRDQIKFRARLGLGDDLPAGVVGFQDQRIILICVQAAALSYIAGLATAYTAVFTVRMSLSAGFTYCDIIVLHTAPC